MVKNIKLNTFFFKEYAQIVEKKTYSAYIPNGSKGIWCIADFNEKTDEKMQEKSEISQKIENSKLIIYPNAAHGSLFQYADEFSKELIEFLGE